nr:hypothetical protein BaRGS_001328 [Batillaria attramentaria]
MIHAEYATWHAENPECQPLDLSVQQMYVFERCPVTHLFLGKHCLNWFPRNTWICDDREMKSENITRPKIVWHATHAFGMKKSPRYQAQTIESVMKYNAAMKKFLESWQVPIFDTFDMTKDLISYDGAHFGIGANKVKAQIFLNYLLELYLNHECFAGGGKPDNPDRTPDEQPGSQEKPAKARAKTATRKKRLRLVMVLLLLWAVAEKVQPVKAAKSGSENLTFPDDGCIREIHWQVQAPEEHGIVLETEFRNRRDANLVSLKTLILKDIGLETIASDSFAIMEELTTLDLRGNPLRNIEKGVFGGVEKLRIVRADEPRICCDYFQQNIEIEECDVPKDELSSCADLLKSDVFRVVLWVFSVLAIAGNAGVLIYRMFVEKEGTSQTYRILVVNLTLSDLVMGVYLAIIGSADAYFRGEYVSREMEWRMSDLCTAAGFLGLLSSEVSALAICLITLDRFLVIQFPFNYRLRLSKVTATIACGATWIAGFLLAAIPLLQTGWDFYGQNGICLPLPITLRPFAGQHYAFGVFVVFNFVLFLVIGAGQVFIFRSVRNSAQSTLRSDRKKEIAIARRLFLIVFTDFCCWFPVGLMGLLASCGVPIPGLVTVLAAVFVLPLNSAVNPYLYTLNTMLERRANRKMRKHIERLMRQTPRRGVLVASRECRGAG